MNLHIYLQTSQAGFLRSCAKSSADSRPTAAVTWGQDVMVLVITDQKNIDYKSDNLERRIKSQFSLAWGDITVQLF